MLIYIGIDDTDNLETRGTGHHARMLGFSLIEAGLFRLHSITRHQLLFDKRIPFTSHNSSACLTGEALSDTVKIIDHCREFLLRESAFDSDAGLCIAPPELISDEIINFGSRAKEEVLSMDEAMVLANKNNIYLDAFINTRMGMIGSLAAVGLRAKGDDGRLLWTKNLRETRGIFKTYDYKSITGTECVTDKEGRMIPDDALLNITEWCRPVMRKGMITLITEQSKIENTEYDYQSASKEFIKSISE